MLHKFFAYLFKNQVILGIFVLILIWFIYQLRDILISIFLSYIIMSAILPIVYYLKKKGFPKILSVLIPYVGIIILIFLLILPLVPFVLQQIQLLIESFPIYLNKSANVLGFTINPREIEQYIGGQAASISKNAFDVTTKVFGGLFSVLTVFIVSFYLLMYHDTFKRFIAKLFLPKDHDRVLDTLEKVNEKLGGWLRGQVILSFLIGTLSWIALTILQVPYALPLALLAGLLEVVPTLGPILSAIPAVIVAFTISPTLALIVVGVYILIQALENHVIVPNLMQKAVGLNPVVVILSIMIGAKLLGVAGALLAIPFVSFLIVIFQSVEETQNK